MLPLFMIHYQFRQEKFERKKTMSELLATKQAKE
jgi:hypothetical protein